MWKAETQHPGYFRIFLNNLATQTSFFAVGIGKIILNCDFSV